MILNTNNLLWFISKELRAIINSNISEFQSACVMTCFDPGFLFESDGNYPVKIAIDTDGTLILISSYLYLQGPPFKNIQIKMNFDFVGHQATYFNKVFPLQGEQKKFSIWEKDFVESYRRGIYKVRIAPVYEVKLLD
jgi:Protein of unknown function (DUF2787)